MTNKVLCSKYGTLPKACFQYWNFRQNHWFFLGWKHVIKSWVRDVLGNVPNSRFEIAYFKSYISQRKLGCICMTNKVLCSKYVTWPKACFEYWNFRQNHWFFFGWKHVKFFSNRELGTFWEMSLTHKIHIFF